MGGFDKCYTNGIYAVGIVRISFEAGFNQGIPETMSAAEFAHFWKTKTDRDAAVETDALTPYYTYEHDERRDDDGLNVSMLYYLGCFLGHAFK